MATGEWTRGGKPMWVAQPAAHKELYYKNCSPDTGSTMSQWKPSRPRTLEKQKPGENGSHGAEKRRVIGGLVATEVWEAEAEGGCIIVLPRSGQSLAQVGTSHHPWSCRLWTRFWPPSCVPVPVKSSWEITVGACRALSPKVTMGTLHDHSVPHPPTGWRELFEENKEVSVYYKQKSPTHTLPVIWFIYYICE